MMDEEDEMGHGFGGEGEDYELGDYDGGEHEDSDLSDPDEEVEMMQEDLGADPLSWSNLLSAGQGGGGAMLMGRSSSTSARRREQERIQRPAMLRAGAPGKDDGTGLVLGMKLESEEKFTPP